MKTFLFSYIASVLGAVLFFLPSVKAAPLEILPRIFFYLGFPMAVFVSMILMVLLYLAGFPGYRKNTERIVVKSAQSGDHLEEPKAA